MSEESESDPGTRGLALLLGGGVADAMMAVEDTLATVRGAADRVFGGLARVQAAGATVATVPPAPRLWTSTIPAPETTQTPETAVRPTEQYAPPPGPAPTRAETVAAFAPVSVPGGGWMAPTAAAAPPVMPAATSVTFASFAPAASSAMPVGGTMVPAAEMAAVASPAAMPLTGGTLPAAAPWQPTAPEPAWAQGVAPTAPPADGPLARTYAPPAPAATQGGPTGGDVFLDGTRVGTWLADHLSREAGRPQTGATAFDPMLSPAWPGTLQGG